ncbi:class I SAM-dependent methyltransferase [Nocardiopsis halophila]|uniref:class I SAM-dependent methyltransferase n=1 Tax=Nocardiopsis halophila TaxID=141692 RepID=UPI000345053F|nr:class I SAM-dependent methyltransferase [Nocardiopsis halophila]
MNAPGTRRFAPDWLALREPADAAARHRGLAAEAGRFLRRPEHGAPLLVCDLGGGTGSMARWTAPILPGPQHWVVYDRDEDLLRRARAGPPSAAADGRPVTVETRTAELTVLTGSDLRGADLVTASALLDVLTTDEAYALVAACTGARCPALLTLSVAGRVVLAPEEPLDREIEAAFNAHQRRESGGRTLLGPDAPGAVAQAFAGAGAHVLVRDSPWRLGPDLRALAAAWLEGWVAAAVEQRPDLGVRARDYLDRRRSQCADGDLHVEVHHRDLLALPDDGGGGRM